MLSSLAIVFAGCIAFSAWQVRFTVDGKQQSEFVILKKTLTDSVRRGTNGTLFNVAASKDVGDASQRSSKQPCPT